MAIAMVKRMRAQVQPDFWVPLLKFALFVGCLLQIQPGTYGQSPDQSQTPVKAAPAFGTIQSINGDTIVLVTDAGLQTKVLVDADVKYLRVPPGSKDLKVAVPIQKSDLQTGDRILVRGKAGELAGTFQAATIISMKKSDLDEKKAHDQEEWQRHGIGGLVKKVDAGNGTATISTISAGVAKDVTVNITKSTILRKYASGSVSFDDAKASTIEEVRTGDQLRARGKKSDDGVTFAADEVVTGSFRNVSGTVSSIDVASGTMTVADLLSNKTVTVRVKTDTQLRKLPAPMAQMIAARLKSATNGGATPAGSSTNGGAPSATSPGPTQDRSGSAGGGRGDLQQMLSRLPASNLIDFQKGGAVLIVATISSEDTNPTAITVVGGVESILQAASQGQAASILSPWSLNGGGGGDAGTP